MKAFRIIQLIGFVMVGGYLLLLHLDNDRNINMPFFISMPPAIVIAVGILLGFVAGLVPGQIGLWRKSREMRKKDRRIRELEQHLPNYRSMTDDEDGPVIPDRNPYTPNSEPV